MRTHESNETTNSGREKSHSRQSRAHFVRVNPSEFCDGESDSEQDVGIWP